MQFYNSQILDKKKKASSKELIAEKLRDSKNLWRSVICVTLSHDYSFSQISQIHTDAKPLVPINYAIV